MPSYTQPEPELIELLRKSGSNDKQESMSAMYEFTRALQEPLRQGIMSGDIVNPVFSPIQLAPDAAPEFSLDLLAPGTEKDFVAYTIPQHGRIPERHVEGDYVMVNTFPVGNAIDWLLKYARSARWDIVGRAMQVFEAGFVKKMNDDAWHTLIAAAFDRNILVYDADANTGQFTKRLVSLMKVIMRRNGGGNSTSLNRGKLTDLFLSPEAVEDIRNWGVDLLDDTTRREVFLAPDGSPQSIFQVALHDLDEFGEGQEYQDFWTTTLGASLASGDVELVLGVDMMHKDSFVMPVRMGVEIFPDEVLHRQQRAGVYGWAEQGYGVLDGRRVLAGSL